MILRTKPYHGRPLQFTLLISSDKISLEFFNLKKVSNIFKVDMNNVNWKKTLNTTIFLWDRIYDKKIP
jgi:hypothetical protein